MSKVLPLGVYVGNTDSSSATGAAAFNKLLTQFIQTVGGTPNYIDQFINYSLPASQWVKDSNSNAYSLHNTASAAAMIPVVGVPMASQASGSGSLLSQLQAIANGADDSVWVGIVDGYKYYGFTTIDLRLGWEMNGGWEPWSITTTAEATAYIAAFRHIANLVHGVAGIKVNVVWNPDDITWTAVSTAATYPGDQYVDIVATDLYSPVYPVSLYDWSTGKTDATLAIWAANPVNREHYWEYPDASQWKPTGTGTGWGLADAMAFAKAHDKPFGLGETGAGGNGTTTGPVDEGALGTWLAKQLFAAGAPTLAFADVWDINVSDGKWDFTDGSRPNEAAGWAKLVTAMEAASKSTATAADSTLATVSTLAAATDLAVNSTTDLPATTGVASVDPGPTLAAGSGIVGTDQTVDLSSQLASLITPGLAGDTETITAVSAAEGSATLGTDGSILYTAPDSGTDSLSYTVTDSAGNVTSGIYGITVDPGPSASATTVVLPHGWTLAIGPDLLNQVTPGLPGDTVVITAASALAGSVSVGLWGDVTYVVPAQGTDTISYTATDQLGDSVSSTYNVIADSGPLLAAGTVSVAAGATIDLAAQISGLITPGQPGDTETITAVSAVQGSVSLGTNGSVIYTAPLAPGPDGAGDTLTYTVQDQFGQVATGRDAVSITPASLGAAAPPGFLAATTPPSPATAPAAWSTTEAADLTAATAASAGAVADPTLLPAPSPPDFGGDAQTATALADAVAAATTDHTH